MSQSHRIKDRTTDKVFQVHQEKCFSVGESAPIRADFGLFNFVSTQSASHILKEREKK